MPRFSKLILGSSSIYKCRGEFKTLRVIKGPLHQTFIGKNDDPFFLRLTREQETMKEKEEGISEAEFKQAVGDIQGNIKNFMDRLNINE